MSIDAMKQALEALEKTRDENVAYMDFKEPYHEAITALRTAIEQAEKQEPVAWGVFDGLNLHDMFFTKEEAHEMVGFKGDGSTAAPLYTSPPASKPWVGLTVDEVWKDDEVMALNAEMGLSLDQMMELVEWANAKLREKNA